MARVPPTQLSEWVVLVPVKPPSRGKSRMRLPAETRSGLATAFALDTVVAALGCPDVAAVIAVTDDFRLAARLAEAGCHVLPDGVGGDLNGSLVQAALEATRRRPGAGLAALCGDLPALRAPDLTAALAAVPARGAAYVADAAGTGTTMYAARSVSDFRPAFGPGSAAAHRAAGAVPLSGDWPTLRQDVDVTSDLAAASSLGTGRHTGAALGQR